MPRKRSHVAEPEPDVERLWQTIVELYDQAKATKDLYDNVLKRLRVQTRAMPTRAREAANATLAFSPSLAPLAKSLAVLADAAESFQLEIEELAELAGDVVVPRRGPHSNNIELMIAAIIEREFKSSPKGSKPPWNFVQEAICSRSGIRRAPGTLARAVSRARVRSSWFRDQWNDFLDQDEATVRPARSSKPRGKSTRGNSRSRRTQ